MGMRNHTPQANLRGYQHQQHQGSWGHPTPVYGKKIASLHVHSTIQHQHQELGIGGDLLVGQGAMRRDEGMQLFLKSLAFGIPELDIISVDILTGVSKGRRWTILMCLWNRNGGEEGQVKGEKSRDPSPSPRPTPWIAPPKHKRGFQWDNAMPPRWNQVEFQLALLNENLGKQLRERERESKSKGIWGITWG